MQPIQLAIISCSPRKGGNCDTAAQTIERQCAKNGQKSAVFHLRDSLILPCIACGTCAKNASRLSLLSLPEDLTLGCPQAKKDDSKTWLRTFIETPLLCITAPIYFYHVPAQFKALIDRMQPFWEISSRTKEPDSLLPPRLAHCILIAGRKKGPQLFDGSLLTLRLAMRQINRTLAEPLLLRGLDAQTALQNTQADQTAIINFADKMLTGTEKPNR